VTDRAFDGIGRHRAEVAERAQDVRRRDPVAQDRREVLVVARPVDGHAGGGQAAIAVRQDDVDDP
jgi:hypothetical protein